MAKRVVTVVLDVEIEDLSDDFRQELANDMMLPVSELDTLENTNIDCVLHTLEYIERDNRALQDMLFEGTDLYVQFGSIKVKKWYINQ